MRILQDSSQAVDLVLVDIDMCGKLECVKDIRKKFNEFAFPIVALSESRSDDLVVDSFGAGSSAHLFKPVTGKVLMAHIRQQLHIISVQQSAARFVPDEFLLYLNRKTLTEVPGPSLPPTDLNKPALKRGVPSIRAYSSLPSAVPHRLGQVEGVRVQADLLSLLTPLHWCLGA